MPTEDYSGYYFASKMDNGFDNLFMAIDDTITFNEVAGIKKVLFLEKIQELQSIFEEEPLEVLQTIEFKYKKKKTDSTPVIVMYEKKYTIPEFYRMDSQS